LINYKYGEFNESIWKVKRKTCARGKSIKKNGPAGCRAVFDRSERPVL